MKTPEQIINEIRGFISNTNPFKFSYLEETVLNLLTELENTLSPSKSIIEEPIIEEVIEETVIEEPVVAKKSTKKK
jgi:hypothetical protein